MGDVECLRKPPDAPSAELKELLVSACRLKWGQVLAEQILYQGLLADLYLG
jgi:hypothetical protein